MSGDDHNLQFLTEIGLGILRFFNRGEVDDQRIGDGGLSTLSLVIKPTWVLGKSSSGSQPDFC